MAGFDNSGVYATLAPTTMLWPNLFTAKAYQKNGKDVGEPKFSAAFSFLPDSTDLTAMKQKAAGVARAKWPGCSLKMATKATPLDGIWWPFKNGADFIKDGSKIPQVVKDFITGKVVLSGRTKKAPGLGKMTPAGIVTLEGAELDRAKGLFYTGANVIFEVNFWPNEGSNGEKYITAYLNSVVTYGTGEKMGGGPSLAERFKGYVGSNTVEDPTVGSDLDDEVPF